MSAVKITANLFSLYFVIVPFSNAANWSLVEKIDPSTTAQTKRELTDSEYSYISGKFKCTVLAPEKDSNKKRGWFRTIKCKNGDLVFEDTASCGGIHGEFGIVGVKVTYKGETFQPLLVCQAK